MNSSKKEDWIGHKLYSAYKSERRYVVGCLDWNWNLEHAISALKVDYMLWEKISERETEIRKKTTLKHDKDNATMLHHRLKAKLRKSGLNSDKAMTGRKPQGIYCNRVMIRSCNCTT